MQNIPSHATDIRHMFRATPAEKINVAGVLLEDNAIHIKLPNWYLVDIVGEDEQMQAKDITPGVSINLLNNKVMEPHIVKDINVIDTDVELVLE